MFYRTSLKLLIEYFCFETEGENMILYQGEYDTITAITCAEKEQHARLIFKNGTYVIIDCGIFVRTNGTAPSLLRTLTRTPSSLAGLLINVLIPPVLS